MSYNLFLDDRRYVADVDWVALPYASWVYIRSYEDFLKVIKMYGIPAFVSYDCDLCDEHYEAYFRYRTEYPEHRHEFKTKCGIHCLEHLLAICKEKGIAHPSYALHTQNEYARVFMDKLIREHNAKLCESGD